MSKKTLSPSPIGDVRVEREGDLWAVVFVRELRHSPEAVWQSLTDPAALREWAPFDPNRSLATAGPAVLTMAGDDSSDTHASVVLRAEPPHLLEYTWGDDVLRWQLEPIATGTRLTLRHAMHDRSWLSKVTAGWHLCIDVAERYLEGAPFGRIVGDEARAHGWEALNAAYAARLGIPKN